MVIDTVIHTLLGGLTLDPAGMHCPSWDDAFVYSSVFFSAMFSDFNSARFLLLPIRVVLAQHCYNKNGGNLYIY